MYNKNLSLAIEYNGKQHYEFIPFFHKTLEQFKKNQERDIRKNLLCLKHNVKLITVPYTVKETEIYNFLINELKKLNFKFDIQNKEPIQFKDYIFVKLHIEKLCNKCGETDKNMFSYNPFTNDKLQNICIKCSKEKIEKNKKLEFTCEYCSVKYITSQKLRYHIKIKHQNNLKFKCNKCNNNFNTEQGLNLHINLVHINNKKHINNMREKSNKTIEKKSNNKKIAIEKKCSRCLCLKKLDDFHKSLKTIGGYNGICKNCRNYENRFEKIKLKFLFEITKFKFKNK